MPQLDYPHQAADFPQSSEAFGTLDSHLSAPAAAPKD